MKSIASFTFLFLFSLALSAQSGGFGFLDISYATISEKFVDNTSDAFSFPDDIKLAESGVGIGGSGVFILKRFAVGGGGGVAFIPKSQGNTVSMNIGYGHGTLGYTFSGSEGMIIIPSLRIGGFGNTLNFTVPDSTDYVFGTSSFAQGEHSLTSGSFSFGVQVDIIKTFSQINGVAVGVSAYYNAPFTTLAWNNGDALISGFEEAAYSHYGIVLKLGGGIYNDY